MHAMRIDITYIFINSVYELFRNHFNYVAVHVELNVVAIYIYIYIYTNSTTGKM